MDAVNNVARNGLASEAGQDSSLPGGRAPVNGNSPQPPWMRQAKNGGGAVPPGGPGRPGGMSPEELGRAFGIRALGWAVNCDNICDQIDLAAVLENLGRNYMAPMDSRWFRHPSIYSGGEVDMNGWVAAENAPSNSCRKLLMASGHVLCEYRGREAYMPGIPYGRSVGRDWQSGDLIVDEDVLAFANADEARRFWAAFIQVFRDFASTFTPAVFDWLRFHYVLGNERNLYFCLGGFISQLQGAVEAGGVRDVIARFNGLLREADDRLSIDDDVLVWYAGRDSDGDTEYWLDFDRYCRGVQALEDDRRRWVQEYEAAERAAYGLGEPGSPWVDDDDTPPGPPASPGGNGPATAGQPDGGAASTPPDPVEDNGPARQADGEAAVTLGERIQKAIEPILAGVEGDKRLDELHTLSGCLRDAVDRERASLRQWIPFPLDVLPWRVADFIRAVAEAHSVDPSFVALPVLAVAGAAMGNAWRLRMKDGFDVPPVLWCILVARTGSNKSGPLSVVVGPMWQPPPMPAAAASLLAVQQGQYVIDDATSEAVIARLGECPRGLLLSGEELAGWLRSFDAYRKGSGGDEQKWIRLWDVKYYRVDRKTDNERSVIPAPAVSIAGAIQPELLGEAADPGKLASGFFSRVQLSMPPDRKRRWSRVGVSQEQADFWKGLVDSLRTTPFASLDPNAAQYLPNIVSPSPDAEAAWVRWYDEVSGRVHGSAGVERALAAKADVQAARLALVLFGIECALGTYDRRSPMPEATMAAGVRLAGWFLDETLRVFDATCGSAQDEKRAALLSLVHHLGGKVCPRDLQRSNARAYPTSEAAKDALRDLAAAGHGSFDGRVFIARKHGSPPP